MYAKLFSRITESSLMEEPMNVRYTFVMLLAIADPTGHVIGTDVAIARRLNMPVPELQQCIAALMAVDPHSNSKEEDGRRVVLSEGERGYLIVNYLTYREMKTEEQRREYMRKYMDRRRNGGVNSKPRKHRVNSCKQKLTVLTHAEGEAEAKAEGEKKQVADAPSLPAAAQPTQPTVDDFITEVRKSQPTAEDSYIRNKYYGKAENGFGQNWRMFAHRVGVWWAENQREQAAKKPKEDGYTIV